MAFKRIEEMDEDDFLMGLKNNPKELRIIDVGDLRESDSENGGYYFYVTFENPENFQTFDMGYNVKMTEDGGLFIGSKSKLYPLASFVSGIDDGGIWCDFEDIKEGLEGLSFMASTRREKFGNKKYFIIIPVDDGEGEDF